MRRHLGFVALLALGVVTGCKDSKPTGSAVEPEGSGGGDDGTGDDGTGDEGTDDGTDDGGDEGGEDVSYAFEDPGDVVPFEDEEGTALIDLSDQTGDESNKDNEFLLVLINTSTTAYGYELRYTEAPEDTDTGGGGAAGPAGPLAVASPAAPAALSPGRARLREARRTGRLGPATPPAAPPPPYGASDIGSARRQFQVRDSIEDDDSSEPVDATLWAVGSYVDIWVDDGWPINFDADCDGTPERIHPAGAFGFDNCDLALIADAIDANIHPTMSTVFGDVPDVNGDGKVTVVITPNLNQMTTFLDEEDDSYGEVVRSYVDPEVDLNDFDASDNPNSNEQEIIFVFAPDESGAVNPAARTSVDSYTEVELLAEVARGYQRLISYKYHVIDTGNEDGETTWVQEGLSALAADLTGFGSVYYDDVWDYLDAPHITPLVDESDLEVINTDQWGAQYLFFRWLYEHADDLATLGQDSEGGAGDTGGGSGLTGEQLVAQLVQSSDVGTDNITNITGLSMEELVLYWQVSMATAGREKSDGSALVSEDEWPPYDAATTVTAPTSSPSAGDLYGANGYQQGINLAGVNTFMEGGFTDGGTAENVERRVTTSGLDLSTMVTGFNYFGYVAANYGTQVTRLSDIPYDEGALLVDALGSGYIGVVVRLEDPASPDYIVENIFSSTDATDVSLQALPADGTPIRALGAIQDKGASFIRTADGEEELAPVYDTDRFLLDLTDRAASETVKISVHLERRYVDRSGTVGPSDPWLSVVPKNLVPHPTVSTINSSSCSGHPITFAYPSSVTEHLYYQLFLSSDAVGTDFQSEEEEGDSGATDGGGTGGEGGGEASTDFDPCGTLPDDDTGAATTLDCTNDFDLDGVPDALEALPSTFLQQVQVMQCNAYGRGGFVPVGSEIIDTDHIDEDEDSYFDRAANLGGLFGEDGEEAYLETELTGGAEYLIVVGAGDDTGPYELTVTQLND